MRPPNTFRTLALGELHRAVQGARSWGASFMQPLNLLVIAVEKGKLDISDLELDGHDGDKVALRMVVRWSRHIGFEVGDWTTPNRLQRLIQSGSAVRSKPSSNEKHPTTYRTLAIAEIHRAIQGARAWERSFRDTLTTALALLLMAVQQGMLDVSDLAVEPRGERADGQRRDAGRQGTGQDLGAFRAVHTWSHRVGFEVSDPTAPHRLRKLLSNASGAKTTRSG